MKKIVILLSVILLLAACQPIAPSGATTGSAAADNAASPFAGDWDGELSIADMTLRILVSLEENAGAWTGTFSIPQQGASDLPLHSIAVDGSTIHMEALEGNALGVFDGAVDADGVIAGVFLQGGFEGTFTLRALAPVDAAALPYVAEEVTFASDGATLAGTLTLPEGEGPFPAIVLVSGSGPQNRDEELPLLIGYAPFREIADRLTRNGFVVLRYDDRGVGDSTGDFASATTATFADDARAAIDFLRNRSDVDPAQVGILGHSEGSNVAAMVGASDPDLAYIVAWAGPAVTGKEVIILQSGLQMAQAGGAPEDVQRYRDELQRAIQYAISDDEEGLRIYLDNVIRAAYVQLPEEQQATLGPMEVAIAAQVEAQIESLTAPWMMEFLTYNPAEDWAQVTTPVLAFYGGLDTQVDASQNIAPLRMALAENPDVTIETLPTANHLFVEAQTGAVSEYSSLQPQLLPEFLDMLTAWLLEHATTAE